MRILLINAYDVAGGAEAICRTLAEGYLSAGHTVTLAVGWQQSTLPYVRRIGDDRTASTADRVTACLARYRTRVRGVGRIERWFTTARAPLRALRAHRGIEEFDYPASRALLRGVPGHWDLVHLHNAHGGYFDLRAVARLSWQVPVVVTLHDAWLLAGHCAHSLGCQRWETGCGRCPDLDVYPPIRRDGTRINWRRKKRIVDACQLYVTTPCEWLRVKALASLLSGAIKASRVIHNGVDLNVFQPADRRAARASLELPEEADIVMCAANGLKGNKFKDYGTLVGAVTRLAHRRRRPLICLAVGDGGETVTDGNMSVRFVPFDSDVAKVAALYNAADVYVHPAVEDTFPTSILEAMACGRPVVASNVGGIPEQIDHNVSGFLCEPRQPEALATLLERLLEDAALQRRIGASARRQAEMYFGRERCLADYMDWYEEVLARAARPAAAPGGAHDE